MRYGFAYRHKGIVWVNEDLPRYPSLYAEVIRHEEGHQPGDYCLQDLLHDLRIAGPQKMTFILTHPRTWTIISPIWREEGHLVYDPSLTLLYILLGGLLLWQY